MNLGFVDILMVQIEDFSGCPYVTFFEKVNFVFLANKHPASDVKLSVPYQQWAFNVFLDHK